MQRPCWKRTAIRSSASMIREAKVFKQAALRGQIVNQIKGPRAAVCWEDYAKVGAELMQ